MVRAGRRAAQAAEGQRRVPLAAALHVHRHAHGRGRARRAAGASTRAAAAVSTTTQPGVVSSAGRAAAAGCSRHAVVGQQRQQARGSPAPGPGPALAATPKASLGRVPATSPGLCGMTMAFVVVIGGEVDDTLLQLNGPAAVRPCRGLEG